MAFWGKLGRGFKWIGRKIGLGAKWAIEHPEAIQSGIQVGKRIKNRDKGKGEPPTRKE